MLQVVKMVLPIMQWASIVKHCHETFYKAGVTLIIIRREYTRTNIHHKYWREAETNHEH